MRLNDIIKQAHMTPITIIIMSTHTHTHTHHLLGSLLSVHEALGDHPWGQDLVPLSEFLEQDTVWEPKSADPNSLQHSVAAQLVKDELGSKFSRLFLVVGDDAAYKVWLS